ncbi:DUF192 domain-containing protein [Roseospira goensis]|uniref:DUF192 domain-containing protein n=1 Tax=Roseospira goensis TaxID=391922 RepID=A0A7W6WKQ9_9PROT|nr:DUF192 domain-containing protein [Roseospira goensis]MBB4286049.1 hypothetical protein [Roseospira goensis]
MTAVPPSRFPAALTRRRLVAGLLAAPAVVRFGPAATPAAAAAPAVTFARSAVAVVTHDGRRYTFSVEVARTPAQRARGLMYRRRLAPDHGMLFDFGGTGPRAMWMKNTYVALDILFLEADGRIWKIAADTTPLSEATIVAEGPIRAALELRAGTSRLLGIEVGDDVRHPMFGDPPVRVQGAE